MIRSRRKRTTIRRLNITRWNQIFNTRTLNLYDGPSRSKTQIKIGDAKLIRLQKIENICRWIDNATDEQIYCEGFDSKDDMKKFFTDQYKDEVDTCVFMLIEFDYQGQ